MNGGYYMPNHRMTRDELIEQFDISIKRLETLERLTDDGEHDELVASLAVAIRTLVHDTNNGSISLLQHLDLKSKKFKTLTHQNDGSAIPGKGHFFALATFEIIQENQTVILVPFKNDRELVDREYKWKSFETWWNSPIAWEADRPFSRWDFIKFVANKAGGAHFDIKLNEFLQKLNSEDTFQMMINYKDGTKETLNTSPKVLPAAIKQIAYELIETMKDMKEKYFS